MKAWASERVLFLAVVFVAPLLYLAWQALADPRIEFLVPSARADWALHPHQGVLDLRGTPVSRDLGFRRSFSLREVPTHLILRYRETGSVAGLLRTSTPRAVLYSGLTTMCSFGSLIVSDHRGTASMGYLLLISLPLALVCALVILPALLSWREELDRRKASPA